MDVDKRRRGFSLIELMAVVVLLGMGLTALSFLFVGGIISNMKAQRIGAAQHRAQQEMEKMRSAGYSGAIVDSLVFPSTEGYSILVQNPNKTGQIGFLVPELPSGQGTIDIAYYLSPEGYYPNLKDVTIGVTWEGGHQVAGQVQVQTFLANQP